MVNKVNRKKSTARENVKAASKKNEYSCGNNISRTYSDYRRKLLTNQSQKSLVNKFTSN